MLLPPEPELTDGPDLLLRRHRPVDVDGVLAQCQDPEFQRWTGVPVPYAESHAAEFLSAVADAWRVGTRACLAVVHQGRYAGTVALTLDGARGADVTFGLGHWARGKGLMTRALRRVLAWAFTELNLKVVHWRAIVGNWPARGVAARCGFKVEGTVRGLIAQRGTRVDGWIGSLRRGDFLTGGPRRVRAGAVSALRAATAPDTGARRGGVATIRQADEADLDAVLALVARRDHSVDLRSALAGGNAWVAVDDQTVIGAVVWNRDFFALPFVSLVVVAATHRRTGVASALFDAVENACPGQRVFTCAHRGDATMQRFLQQRGYRRSGEIDLGSADREVFYQFVCRGVAAG